MQHFFIKKSSIRQDTAVITGSDAHHAGKVLRCAVGDTLYLLDEEGWEYQGVITGKTAQRIDLKLFARNPPQKTLTVSITLGQAVPKAHKMDYIIQKATELGVSSVIPFLSSRTGPRLPDERLQKRCQRWQKIALEATKQCGRRDMPVVESIVSFEELINKGYNNLLKIILWEDEKNRRLKEVLRNSGKFQNLILLVGPEGGFSAGEIERARQHGFLSVSLGRSILRTETVALYLLSVLHYELENMSS